MGERGLNATAASLLGFLHERPMTGWDLVATAQALIGDFWSLTRSQVYRELATMERNGLIRAGEIGARDKRPYELTDEGRASFAAWVEREPGQENIRYPLLLTLAFGKHVAPERLAAFLASHRQIHAARLEGYEAIASGAGDGLDPYARATLDFGIRYERAVLDWFDHLPPELTGGARS